MNSFCLFTLNCLLLIPSLGPQRFLVRYKLNYCPTYIKSKREKLYQVEQKIAWAELGQYQVKSSWRLGVFVEES